MKVRLLDFMTGVEFESTADDILRCISRLNYRITNGHEQYCSIADLYLELGLSRQIKDIHGEYGWNLPINDVRFILSEHDDESTLVSYNPWPRPISELLY